MRVQVTSRPVDTSFFTYSILWFDLASLAVIDLSVQASSFWLDILGILHEIANRKSRAQHLVNADIKALMLTINPTRVGRKPPATKHSKHLSHRRIEGS